MSESEQRLSEELTAAHGVHARTVLVNYIGGKILYTYDFDYDASGPITVLEPSDRGSEYLADPSRYGRGLQVAADFLRALYGDPVAFYNYRTRKVEPDFHAFLAT